MDKIWQEGFTIYDQQIIKNLKEIQSELTTFFEKEGKVVFDWSGELIEHSFDNWQKTGEENKGSQWIKKIVKKNLENNPMSFGKDFDLGQFLLKVKDLTKESIKPVFGDLKLNDIEDLGLSFKEMKIKRKKSLSESNLMNLLFYHWFKLLGAISEQDLKTIIEKCIVSFEMNDLESKKIAEDFFLNHVLYLSMLLTDADDELQAEMVTEIHMINNFHYTMESEFFDISDSISILKRDFLNLPFKYIGGHQTNNKSLFYYISSIFSANKTSHIDDAEKYLALDERCIINAKAYFGYMLVEYFIPLKNFNRFGEYPQSYFLFLSDKEVKPTEYISNHIFKLIKLRIEVLDARLDSFLTNFKKEKKLVEQFESEEEFLKYLLAYYAVFLKNDKLFLPILGRIKFPKIIDKLMLKCLCQIIEKKISVGRGYRVEDVLNPLQIEELLSSEQFETNEKKTGFEDIEAIQYPFFIQRKINWSSADKYFLIEAFSRLFLQKNRKGVPFMEERHVDYIVRTNFSCFKSHRNEIPKPFKFNGSKKTLTFFIQEIYDATGHKNNPKRRYAQFLTQNFDCFSNSVTTPKQLQNLADNIKKNRPKRSEIIDIEDIKSIFLEKRAKKRNTLP